MTLTQIQIMKYNLLKDIFNIDLKKEKEPIQDQIEAFSKKLLP